MFDHAGAFLYSAGDDGNVIQWDMRSHTKITYAISQVNLLTTSRQWGGKGSIQKIAINPAGSILATGKIALHKFNIH